MAMSTQEVSVNVSVVRGSLAPPRNLWVTGNAWIHHRTDSQEAFIILNWICRSKKWTQRLCSGNSRECKNMGPITNVIKGNGSHIHIQEDPHSMKARVNDKNSQRHGAGGEDTCASQAHSPEAKFWRQQNYPLSINRFFANAHVPFFACPHLHLPVVAAGGEPRGAQDTHCIVESLGMSPPLLLETPTSDLSQVLGNDEILVGCVNIQGHLHCG